VRIEFVTGRAEWVFDRHPLPLHGAGGGCLVYSEPYTCLVRVATYSRNRAPFLAAYFNRRLSGEWAEPGGGAGNLIITRPGGPVMHCTLESKIKESKAKVNSMYARTPFNGCVSGQHILVPLLTSLGIAIMDDRGWDESGFMIFLPCLRISR